MLNRLQNFNIDDASLTLWVYRKSIRNSAVHYTGWWVSVSDELRKEFNSFISEERCKYSEVINYGLLSQNNESSLLHIGANETEAQKLIDCSSNQIQDKKAKDIKDIANCNFYSVKLVHNDVVLYCVKKTDASWKTKKKKGIKSLIYKDYTLTIDNEPKFNIAMDFDFFILEGDLLIKDKRIFESILSYKQAYLRNLTELTNEAEFNRIFTDTLPLVTYVGNNAMQLRRALAIREKGYYKNTSFMKSLRLHAEKFKLNIQFDKEGKIIAKDDSCADIFQALLDHRLQSHYPEHLYDVPNALLVR
ncbi:Kiwa anti-phage protein KwaB-like domain-containing protein [Xenorhabdus anantnagensis]|uniref:DUF4868 domain-containing protein n=1 Tax=Xenorhabdus anantnagensis TaxID=3025875 RepID=A0ABT5LRI0_9GAMM|nr:Kiwa anti-phage protein KwaB-like domain-containing protein [Xenorhabdus anantnagensis]MDC9597030.1 DUF4868 domain-containing protein [Xenorhabdus anantnagensis]